MWLMGFVSGILEKSGFKQLGDTGHVYLSHYVAITMTYGDMACCYSSIALVA